MSRFTSIMPLASALLCFAAGVYLLQTQSVGEDSFLEVIAHGMGLYFIGKGVFVFGSLQRQDEMIRLLRPRAMEEEDRAARLWRETASPSPDG